MKYLKLRDVLNHMYDETFVTITDFKGVVRHLWVADYIGGDKRTMAWLKKMLDKRIDFGTYMTIKTESETKNDKVPVLCIKLEK